MNTYKILSDNTTITGSLTGTDEMFNVNRFYQILTTEDGKRYKAYYDAEDQPDALDDEGNLILDSIDYGTISELEYICNVLFVGIPTGNWYEDETLEIGRTIEIEYTDDLLEKLDDLSEDEYMNGLIDGIHIREWIEQNNIH